jgi:hypothetical protein
LAAEDLCRDMFASKKDRRGLIMSFAGQAVGIKEIRHDIWLVSLVDYDLGYFDVGTQKKWRARQDLNLRPSD